ncbi:MAG TPA: zeta toxin family protein [Burkholderiales bacterium]|nr:zeta toxin family protein [Burkholderiales bacterium]
MPLSDEELKIQHDALQFAKANRRGIARRRTDPSTYLPEEHPVSVFMAGSPGAGKTEASIELIAKLGTPVIRIDPDELRDECPGYKGANAYLFQAAVSVLVEKIHDMALEQRQSFLLDGTLSNYDRARRNINRSLGKGRTVQILYVYQEPRLAWEFVQAREAAEGRRIPTDQFVDQYFAARDVVNRLKRELGKSIKVDLLLKNNDNSNRLYQAGVDQIDTHIPERYTRADVEQMLKKS